MLNTHFYYYWRRYVWNQIFYFKKRSLRTGVHNFFITQKYVWIQITHFFLVSVQWWGLENWFFMKQLEFLGFFSQKIEDYKLKMCRLIDLSFYYNWPSFKDHRNPFYCLSLSLLANLLPHSVLNSPKNTSQISFLFILNSSVSHSSLNSPLNRSQESSFNFSS